MTLPAPLTPPESDLQDFPFMPLHVARLRDSDLAAEESPEACWYAVLLWAASWHQLPAGSLPDNDTVLTKLIGLGRDLKTFKKHRDGALRGFVKCSDGRLYHPVVAEQVADAWDGKLRQRWRTELSRIKKANQRGRADDPRGYVDMPSPTFEEFIAPGYVPPVSPPKHPNVPKDKGECPSGHGLQETGTGTGKGTPIEEANASPAESGAQGLAPGLVQAAFDEWNLMAARAGLKKARDLTDDRRKKIGVKLRKVGIEGWRSVLAVAEADDFCRGGGGRGWTLSLDDLFKNNIWNRLSDGGYGQARSGAAPDELTLEQWERLVAHWREGVAWSAELGPAPDQPGTRVPKELLIQPVRGAACG